MLRNDRNQGYRMTTLPTEEALEFASAAINRGEIHEGRQALRGILKREPNNAAAWYWMGFCENDDEAKKECFQRVRKRSERPMRHIR